MNLKVLLVVLNIISFAGFIESTCGTYHRGKQKREAIETNRTTDHAVNYIVGGRFAYPGEFPWQVLLKIYYNWNAYSFTTCGGVIWNSNFILSASHCLLRCHNNNLRRPVRLELCVGDYNIRRNDGEICVLAWRWWTHENFSPCNSKMNNDVSLIQLARPMRLPDLTNNGYGSLNSACHPYENMNPKEATLSGWGRYNSRIHQGTNVLKMVNLPIWSTNECKKHWNVDDSQICAGGVSGENSCMGDSGGPLVTYINGKAYVIGLSSYGPNPCAQRGIPNVFTKVSYYLDWINNTINYYQNYSSN